MDNKYQLGLYEKSMPNSLTITEKIKMVRKLGFDYLELSIDETDEKLERLNMSLEEKKDILNIMIETSTKINSICLSGHRRFPLGSLDLETSKRSLEIAKKAIDLASDLGVSIIQLAGYDVYYEQSCSETKANFFKQLKKVVEYGALKGINLAFETMETDFMDTVEKSMFYINEIDSPYLGVYPDIGNLTNASKIYNSNVFDDLNKGKGRIFAVHLKETKVGSYREVPFGKGHTQFLSAINWFRNNGVCLFVAEFWLVNQNQWKNDCVEASKFLRNFLDEVFSEVKKEEE